MTRKASPLARDEQIHSIAVFSGWATANGNVGGTTIVDAKLVGLNDFVTGKGILIMSGPAQWEMQQASSLVAGTITVASAFSCQITAGTLYRVLTISPSKDIIAALVLLLAGQAVPGVDGVLNLLASQVGGNKGDSALYAATATASLMRYIKALLGSRIIATGTFTTSSATVPADTGRTEGNDYFKGCVIMPLTGVAAFQPRPIRQFTSGTDIFTLDEPFTIAPGLVAYAILQSDYPVQRLLDIFDLTNAVLTLTETGGTLTATGAENTVYINDAPVGEYEPRVLLVDLDLMQAGDTTIIKLYYRLKSGGALQLYDYQSYAEADGGLTNDRKLIAINLLPNRYGIWVTLQQTAGTNRAYDWGVHYAN